MTDQLSLEEQALLVSALTDAVGAPGDLRSALDRVGWRDCLEGAPVTTVTTLARLQGSRLLADSLLDDVVLAAAGIDGVGALVLPALPRSTPPGRRDGVQVVIDGILDRTRDVSRLVVPALGPKGVELLAVRHPLPAALPHGMDLARAVVPLRTTLDIDDVVGDAAAWERGKAAGLRFLALELCGVTRVLLDLAVAHTTTREQFGRPLAAFQAVKHKLADVYVWLECAELAVASAFEDADVLSAALAKGLACRAASVARANCQQVLGGMGFSWEHPLHRYVRRALLLEALLGSAGVLRADIGHELRSTGRLPALAAL